MSLDGAEQQQEEEKREAGDVWLGGKVKRRESERERVNNEIQHN